MPKPPRVICGSITRTGRPCQRLSIPGHWKCANHGGLSTGPKTAAGKARVTRNLRKGFGRWLERQRALKAAGIIDRIPMGRVPGSPPRSKVRAVARAQRLIEEGAAAATAVRVNGCFAPNPKPEPQRSKPVADTRSQIRMTETARRQKGTTNSGGNTLPATPPESATIGLSELFSDAGATALLDIKGVLDAPIDYKRLVDPEWLKDPENRKIALVLAKFAAMQMNAAISVMGGHLKVNDSLRESREEEARRAKALEKLSQALEERSASWGG